MTRAQLEDLVRRLEGADRLSNAERLALLGDIERYARRDLYHAARLCKDHLNQKANLRLPTPIMAADYIEKHFERHTRQARRALELYGEQDRLIRQPEDGRHYRGPVVGATPHCVIQRDRDSGDYIVHARASLTHDIPARDADKDVGIHYPFKAVGGVGLVTEAENSHNLTHQAEHGHAHGQAHQHQAEHGRGHSHERAGHDKSMEMSR